MIENRGFIMREAMLLVHEISIEIDIDITKKSRQRKHTVPRNICCSLLFKELKLTLKDIGIIFGKNHATVINSIKRVEEASSLKDDTSLTYQLYHAQFLDRFKELSKSITYSEGVNNIAKTEAASYSAFIEKIKKQLKDSIGMHDRSVKEATHYRTKYTSCITLYNALKVRFDKLKDEHEKLKSISLLTKDDEREIERMVKLAQSNHKVFSRA